MKKFLAILILVIFFAPVSEAKKRPKYKPYQLVTQSETTFSSAVENVRQQLNDSAFQMVGEYSPYANAHVFTFTHPELLAAASQGELGGFGAVLRMSVTEVADKTQVAFVTPTYMTYLYRIPEVPGVEALLDEVFGKTKSFGTKKAKNRSYLSDYQYMMFMPEFDEPDVLGEFDSHEEAINIINKNLQNSDLKLHKIFQVAVPNKDEVLFGIGILEGEGGDANIMSVIDKGELRHTAHLPYALLVSGKTAYALAGKFRIASSFPDLGMGTFMEISEAPENIKNQLMKLTEK